MRRLMAVVLYLLLSTVSPFVVPASAGTGPASAHTSGPTPGLDSLSACVKKNRSLGLVVLMDESKSLDETDASNSRITAAQAAVTGLKVMTESRTDQKTPVRVEVAVAGFARDFAPLEWRALPGAESRLIADLDGFRDRDDGDATDFGVALTGTRELFARKVADEQMPCRAVLWFTDGIYEPPNVAKKDIESHKERMCGPNGPVEQLRASGITILTVALTTKVGQRDQQFLRAVTGVDPGCGDKPVESMYVTADSEEELADAFADLVPIGTPATPVCDDAGRCSFTLDSVLNSFFAVIRTEDAGQLTLHPPGNGADIPLNRPGSTSPVSVAGAELRWVWFGDTVAVTGTLPPRTVSRWEGTWNVLTNGKPLAGRIFLFGNLQPEIVGDLDFVRGEEWLVKARVTNVGSRGPVSELSPFSPRLTVSIRDGDDERLATARPVVGGSDITEFAFTPPASWRAATVTVTATLRVTTPDGADISPPAATRDIQVSAPLIVDPGALDVPALHGEAGTSDSITIRARDRAGCVWYDGIDVDQLPITVTTAFDAGQGPTRSDGCLRVEPGHPRTLHFRFNTNQGWNGTATGRIALRLAEDGSAATPTEVAFSIPLVADPNGTQWWLIIFAMCGVGAIPLLASIVVNRWWLARFDRKRPLRYGTATVKVTPEPGARQVRVSAMADAEWPTWKDLRRIDTSARSKLAIGDVTVRAHASWWPFAQPRTHISGGAGHVVATPSAGPAPELTDLPLQLGGLVILRADADRDAQEFDAQVVFVVGLEPLTGQRLAALRADIAVAAERLVPATSSARDLTDLPN